MPTYYETGHAKNVANFQDLIAFCTGYGATYNPTKNALKLPQLTTLNTSANNALADVVTKNTAYNNAVNARIASFDGFRALCTRLINAFQTTDATPEKIADAKGFNRKIQGQRSTKIATIVDPTTPAPTTISSSHQSYDQLIQHFAGLISVLQSEPTYAPNENDLKIATLTAKQADMTAKNTALATAFTAISNSRIARDKVLYKDLTGLVPIATDVKKYIKSVFGASSAEYAQVKGIEFKKVKKSRISIFASEATVIASFAKQSQQPVTTFYITATTFYIKTTETINTVTALTNNATAVLVIPTATIHISTALTITDTAFYIMFTALTIRTTAKYIRATAEIKHLTAKSQAVAYTFAF